MSLPLPPHRPHRATKATTLAMMRGKDFVDLGVERRFTEAAAMADARTQMAVDRGFVPVSLSAVRPPGPQSTAGLTDGSTYSQ